MQRVDNPLTRPDWLRALRIYFVAIITGNLAWEVLHLPLYTIWTLGSPVEQAFAVAHCTGAIC